MEKRVLNVLPLPSLPPQRSPQDIFEVGDNLFLRYFGNMVCGGKVILFNLLFSDIKADNRITFAPYKEICVKVSEKNVHLSLNT